MSGRLIIVVGLSGAGKTSLITAAMRSLPNLRYLTTYTTRSPREGEQNNFEHVFVDQMTYQKHRHASKEWDHAEYYGAWYGTDVAAVRTLLKTHDVICAIAPDPAIIRMLEHHYPGRQIVMWVDTPSQVAKSRISHDEERYKRQENTNLAAVAQYIFTPTGELKVDEHAFTRLVTTIINTQEV